MDNLRFSEQESKWPSEGNGEEGGQPLPLIGVGISYCSSGSEAFGLQELAKTLGLLVKDNCMAGLGHCEDEQDPKASQYGHVDPEQPPPTLACCDIATDDQGKWWATGAGEAVDGHCWAAFISCP